MLNLKYGYLVKDMILLGFYDGITTKAQASSLNSWQQVERRKNAF
jgi:hypothetical protein